MRKVLSGILILVFLFNIGGYYLWFSVLQLRIQEEVIKEMKKGLKEEDLCLVIADLNSEQEIKWIKPGREFRYHGEMYDVVKIKIRNQKKYLYCINDVKEKLLINRFHKNHNQTKELEKKSKIAFGLKYIPEQIQSKTFNELSDMKFPVPMNYYKSAFIEIYTPPPKVT